MYKRGLGEGGSIGRGWDLQTIMDHLFSPAHFTLDFATPLKETLTALDDGDFLRPMSSTAAHEIAAIDADTGFIAEAALGTLDAHPWIPIAEVWAHFIVNQILLPRRFVFRVIRLKFKVVAILLSPWAAIVAHHNSWSTVEAILEHVTNNSEIG